MCAQPAVKLSQSRPLGYIVWSLPRRTLELQRTAPKLSCPCHHRAPVLFRDPRTTAHVHMAVKFSRCCAASYPSAAVCTSVCLLELAWYASSTQFEHDSGWKLCRNKLLSSLQLRCGVRHSVVGEPVLALSDRGRRKAQRHLRRLLTDSRLHGPTQCAA